MYILEYVLSQAWLYENTETVKLFDLFVLLETLSLLGWPLTYLNIEFGFHHMYMS